MELLRKLREWWRGFWGCGLSWPMEHDSHQWDNKVEILRRLGSCPGSGPEMTCPGSSLG